MDHFSVGRAHRLQHDLTTLDHELVDETIGINRECLTTSFGITGYVETKTGGVMTVTLHHRTGQFVNRRPDRATNPDQSLGLLPIDIGHDDIVFDLGGNRPLEPEGIDETLEELSGDPGLLLDRDFWAIVDLGLSFSPCWLI